MATNVNKPQVAAPIKTVSPANKPQVATPIKTVTPANKPQVATRIKTVNLQISRKWQHL